MMEGLKYSEILKQNTLLGKEAERFPSYKIKVLSNITCNQFKDVLSYYLRNSQLNPEIELGDYDNIIQETYTLKDAQLVLIHYDLLNIVDKYACFAEDFSDEDFDSLVRTICSEIDLILENLRSLPAIVFNTFIPDAIYTNSFVGGRSELLAEKLNEHLRACKAENLYVFDIRKTLIKIGISGTFDFRMYYLSKTLYTIHFWKEYTYDLAPIILKLTGKQKKAIIFDCDNTLWKGILGEDGATGIDMSPESKWGQIYNKVQQIALWLSKQGILIGVCSKNNQDEVEKILQEHPDCILAWKNVVVTRINWQDKVTNLKAIAKELNIGLDSLVFVDDSSFEINLVKSHLPEVFTFQVPDAIHEYPSKLSEVIKRLFFFQGSSEDLDKVSQYKAQVLREEIRKKSPSLEEYIASLGIELRIKVNDHSQIARVAQLTQKTNQFNLTTKRYTENQIRQFMDEGDAAVFSVGVKDKYGDSGLTAVCIVKSVRPDIVIDSFLMSCRIMGRNIEKAIMNFIVDYYKNTGYKGITGVFYPTAKNKPVENFYEESGFVPELGVWEQKKYHINISEYRMFNVQYIKINASDE